MREEYDFSKIKKLLEGDGNYLKLPDPKDWDVPNIELINQMFTPTKIPSFKIYQNYARIYLDEYPEQKELRKEFFAKRWNLKNDSLKRVA